MLGIEGEDGEAADLHWLLACQGVEHWVSADSEGFSRAVGAVERYPAAGDPAHLPGVVSVLVGEEATREACEVEVHSTQQLGMSHSALYE